MSSSIESFPVPLENMPSDMASLEEWYAALGDSSGMACSVQLDKCHMEQWYLVAPERTLTNVFEYELFSEVWNYWHYVFYYVIFDLLVLKNYI